MIRIIKIAFYPIILSFFCSCEKVIFPEPEELQQVKITYDYFSAITVCNIFNIELKTDSVYTVVIESYEPYIDNISCTMDSGKIEFRDENRWVWLPDYPRPKLHITFPALDDRIQIDAPVSMRTQDTLQLEKLNIVSLGKTGEFYLNVDVSSFQLTTGSDNYGFYKIGGAAAYSRLWPRGSSILDASELLAEDCYVYNNSMGDCWVNVSGRLEVRLNAMGNLYYSGNPTEILLLEESGTGRLKRDP